MTTLTANVSARSDHCTHKLPSSCRLTALPICCACQDIRPHAPLYRKYIDGVGFVLKGRRQERYCWQCKVFWDKRVRDSGVPQEETQIPESPDQAEFITKWFEWHQGFRTIHQEDGSVEKQAVVGEALAEVDIGSLPRTITDLRDGRLESTDQSLIKARQRSAYQARLQAERDGGDDLQNEGRDGVPEEDRLFDPESPSVSAVVPSAAPPPRRRPQNDNFPSSITIHAEEEAETLREEFETTFSERFAAHLSETTRISLFDTSTHYPRFNLALENLHKTLLRPFLLDLHENLPSLDEEDAALMQRFIERCRESGEDSHPHEAIPDIVSRPSNFNPGPEQVLHPRLAARSSETSARNASTDQLPQLRNTTNLTGLNIAGSQSLLAQYERDIARVQRHLARLAPLGTQEDVQDPNYVSPVANMFNNFMTQHAQRQAERRAQTQARPVDNGTSAASTNGAATPASNTRGRSSSIPTRRRILFQPIQAVGNQDVSADYNPVDSMDPAQFRAPTTREAQQARIQWAQATLSEIHPHRIFRPPQAPPDEPGPSLDDSNDNRPPPLDGDDMMVRMQCAVCYTQIATQAVLPCGHLALCKWCQQQAMPSHRLDATQPRDPDATCPVCRRRIQKIVRIYGPEEIASQRRQRRAANAPASTSLAADAAAAELNDGTA